LQFKWDEKKSPQNYFFDVKKNLNLLRRVCGRQCPSGIFGRGCSGQRSTRRMRNVAHTAAAAFLMAVLGLV